MVSIRWYLGCLKGYWGGGVRVLHTVEGPMILGNSQVSILEISAVNPVAPEIGPDQQIQLRAEKTT